MSTALRHRRAFEGTFDAAGDASVWLREVAHAEALSDQLTFCMEVCFEELFTNVSRHGGPGRSPSGEAPLFVTLELDVTADIVDLVIEDNGKPFDVTQSPGKPVHKSIEEIVPGGLGVQLIRSFSSDLLYEALPHGNRVIVKFLRQGQPGGRSTG